jgi:hypothetical protein
MELKIADMLPTDMGPNAIFTGLVHRDVLVAEEKQFSALPLKLVADAGVLGMGISLFL